MIKNSCHLYVFTILTSASILGHLLREERGDWWHPKPDITGSFQIGWKSQTISFRLFPQTDSIPRMVL